MTQQDKGEMKSRLKGNTNCSSILYSPFKRRFLDVKI